MAIKKNKAHRQATGTRPQLDWSARLAAAAAIEDRWFDTRERAAVEASSGPQTWHLTGCSKTGAIYGRVIRGRFRAEADEPLERRIAGLEVILGEALPLFLGGPRWLYAEFLDNIADFELRQPCGCPSRRAWFGRTDQQRSDLGGGTAWGPPLAQA